jgi:hypothetical protein
MSDLFQDLPQCVNFGPVRWRRIAGWLRRIRLQPVS